jgi:hypothetical protein
MRDTVLHKAHRELLATEFAAKDGVVYGRASRQDRYRYRSIARLSIFTLEEFEFAREIMA